MRKRFILAIVIALQAVMLAFSPNSALAGDYLETYLRFFDADGAESFILKAPPTLSEDVTWTLPTTMGIAGEVLETDASGTLSWTSVATDLQQAFEGGSSVSLGTSDFVMDADSTADIYFQDGGVNRVTILDDGTLTLTAGASSTWSTTSGNLTLDTPATLYIGSSGTDAITFTTDGTGDGEVTLPNESISGTEILNNTITASDIADDELDYVDFQDAMDVDAATTVALGANSLTYNIDGASNLVMNASSTGDILLQDGGVNRIQVLDDGTLTLTGGAASIWSTSAGALTIDSAAALNLGTTNATSVLMGRSGITTTNVGTFQVGQNGTDGSLIIYSEQGTTDYTVTFNPNTTMTQSTTYTLPAAYPGSANMALTSSTGGALGWSSVSNMAGVSVRYKSTEESVTNSATLQNDDHIYIDLAANETWTAFISVMTYTANNTPDLQIAVSAPTGATCNLSFSMLNSPSSGAASNLGCGVTSARISLSAGAEEIIFMTLRVTNGGTAGTAYLQWSQATANANPTVFRAGGFIQSFKTSN